MSSKTSLERKIHIITSELEIIKPETLLLNVDPSIEAQEIIDQIQTYHTLIQKEMSYLKHQEKEHMDSLELNKRLNQTTEVLVKPKEADYLHPSEQIKQKSKNKPVIDYQTKIRALEKDMLFTFQNYNETKSQNATAIEELNELRKGVISQTKKLDDLKQELIIQEASFYEQKDIIELNQNLKRESSLFEDISKNQKILEANNMFMIDKIKSSDRNMTQKLAMKKYLDHEKEKLIEARTKWKRQKEREMEEFYKENEVEITKYKQFNPDSKLISILDPNKVAHMEDMLNRILTETKTDTITNCVGYFIKCCDELKKLQEFIFAVTKSVYDLEKEVDELEYIINFCETNLEIKADEVVDDDEQKEIENLKHYAEIFLNYQHELIADLYGKFAGSFNETFSGDIKQQKENFLETFKTYLTELEEETSKLVSSVRENEMNGKSLKKLKKNFDFHSWDRKWDKSDKIKENVKKDFDKSGAGNIRFQTGHIKDLVDNLLLKKKEKEPRMTSINKKIKYVE